MVRTIFAETTIKRTATATPEKDYSCGFGTIFEIETLSSKPVLVSMVSQDVPMGRCRQNAHSYDSMH